MELSKDLGAERKKEGYRCLGKSQGNVTNPCLGPWVMLAPMGVPLGSYVTLKCIPDTIVRTGRGGSLHQFCPALLPMSHEAENGNL